jgi:hypothetical protein
MRRRTTYDSEHMNAYVMRVMYGGVLRGCRSSHTLNQIQMQVQMERFHCSETADHYVHDRLRQEQD